MYKDASSLKIPQHISDGSVRKMKIVEVKTLCFLNQVQNSFVSAVSPLAVYLPTKVKDKIFNN